MKTQKGFIWPLAIIVVVMVAGVGAYIYKGDNLKDKASVDTLSVKDEDGRATTAVPVTSAQTQSIKRLHGVVGYTNAESPKLFFSVAIRANGVIGGPAVSEDPNYQVVRFIKLTFANQDEAIKKLNIDVSKLPPSSPESMCSINGKSMAVIDVTGYDSAKAEKEFKDEVTLKTVVTPAATEVLCATP